MKERDSTSDVSILDTATVGALPEDEDHCPICLDPVPLPAPAYQIVIDDEGHPVVSDDSVHVQWVCLRCVTIAHIECIKQC